MTLISPWTPPVGSSWNPLELYTRIGQGAALTFGEGDQNKTSAEDAINWIGNKIFEILAQIGSSHVTGDIRVSFYPTATEGWILLDGRTVGSASSGSVLTGVTYQPLYEVLWNYATNSDLLTSAGNPTTKGASAVADFSANKRLILPDARGRVLVGAGQGSGLTNRVIMSRFGVESGNLNHNHTINITSAPALTTYTPTGAVTIDEVTLSATPTGSVTVDTYTGNITPLGSVSVATASLSRTPSGTVAVTLNNGAVTGTGTANVNGASCLAAHDSGSHPVDTYIDCTSILTVDISDIAAGITTDVTVTAATFTGVELNLDHNHTATFTGSSTSISHGHSATFVGVQENLNHTHTGTFSGDVVDFEHTHTVLGNTLSATLNYSTVQPSLAAYTYIKL